MEENKGTPLPTPVDHEWENEVRIIEGNAKTSDGQEIQKPDELEEVAVVEESPDQDDEVEVVVKEAPVHTLPDPGEYKAKDYSFDAVIYDDEGKKARTVKIKNVDQFEELLDADANFGSPANLLKAQRLVSKMEVSEERDLTEWQKSKEAYEAEKLANDSRTQALTTMQAEIDYLVNRGDLPKITVQQRNAEWSDPEVAKQPGVKEQITLMNYMARENKAREKVGIQPLRSMIDAFNAYQLDQNKKQASTQKSVQAEQRKEAGARVGSSSPNPVAIAPKGIAVGRVGNISDLANGW